jgi:GMP synthase (glutamine-hydrolysing)
MPILVLRHEPFEHLGRFASVLDARGVPFSYRDLGETLSVAGQDGVIIMGGPMSANDPLPGLAAELALIERAVDARIPLLGICLGAQLIAKAIGARVYRNPEKEIGWAPVHFTGAGQADPLFRDTPSPSVFFHWHGETFDLPAGARWLAYSDKCRHQAFCFAENVYGIQFHPEITAEMIVDWSGQPANCGDVEGLDQAVDPYQADPGPSAQRILDRWLALTGVKLRGTGIAGAS